MNAPNFDRLARIYRWMELASFGPFLWWCRCAYLAEMTSSRRALILGDGDGRFTARLLRSNPTVHVDAIDASPKMLQALRRRSATHAARLRTFAMDVRELSADRLAMGLAEDARPAYDFVVTHFFLDCLTSDEIRSLGANLRPGLVPDARWVVSDFAIPPDGLGRLVAGPLVRFLYWAFGLLTGLDVRQLPDHASSMRGAGFTLTKQRRWLGGVLVSELWVADSRF